MMCKEFIENTDQRLLEQAEKLSHGIKTQNGDFFQGNGIAGMVDIVVVADTSPSMMDEASELSKVAGAAIARSVTRCNAVVRDVWVGLQGTFPDTRFSTTLKNYLLAKGVNRRQLTHRLPEDGGPAIVDIARHFDWRPGASRVIFYLSDEALKGGNSGALQTMDAQDVAAADEAIDVARKQGVTVFMYGGTDIETYPAYSNGSQMVYSVVSEFKRVATATGGIYFQHNAPDWGGFEKALSQIICQSSKPSEGAKTLKLEGVKPSFQLKWGERKRDHLETEGVEVMYLQVHNPFTNVEFAHIHVTLESVQHTDGIDMKRSPQGAPAVEIRPSAQICFDQLAPGTIAARELVLITRGASPDDYQVKFQYCFETHFLREEPMKDTFQFKLKSA